MFPSRQPKLVLYQTSQTCFVSVKSQWIVKSVALNLKFLRFILPLGVLLDDSISILNFLHHAHFRTTIVFLCFSLASRSLATCSRVHRGMLPVAKLSLCFYCLLCIGSWGIAWAKIKDKQQAEHCSSLIICNCGMWGPQLC